MKLPLTVREVVDDPQVSRVLLRHLWSLPPGGALVRVTTTSGRNVTLRAVPLVRGGNVLVKSVGNPEAKHLKRKGR